MNVVISPFSSTPAQLVTVKWLKYPDKHSYTVLLDRDSQQRFESLRRSPLDYRCDLVFLMIKYLYYDCRLNQSKMCGCASASGAMFEFAEHGTNGAHKICCHCKTRIPWWWCCIRRIQSSSFGLIFEINGCDIAPHQNVLRCFNSPCVARLIPISMFLWQLSEEQV